MTAAKKFILLSFSVLGLFVSSCNNSKTSQGNTTDSLTEDQKHLSENALKGLDVFEGLEVHTMATEPMLKNPTNIDVDERGRVWVTEAYNYRPAINGNPTNPAGDRIMILEDTNGDGKMDTAKVFYQGPEVNAPLGVCVLGNKVLISQSPYVWVFYDDNGDDKADRKEILFQGIGGEQHDHGMHTFTFGPDGKLYFNFGNEGSTLKDKNNKPVLDQDGDEIGPKKYQQGMVFRCDTDGSHVECLGQNFRNPYEVAVDSYGLLWQSDNDDDGNKGTRINYVMDYGNYGYRDEVTKATWYVNRTNIEDSIPLRHWHLNDPGVVPNLLQTGAGSPTGILVYEGSLLPKEFQGQLIHSDAGPNVVRSYSITKNGAGYSAKIIDILKGDRDQWFRPADVCIAPDGSLIVADWYDPGVGGHQAGDQTKGRIYRVAPPSSSTYSIEKQDYSTPEGAVKALQNANLSTRYHAFTTLQDMGVKAVPALEKLWLDKNANARMRARAFWALVKLPGANAGQYIQQAIKEDNPDIRITGIRAARETGNDVAGIVKALLYDKDEQVRRECLLALRHSKAPEAADLWATLAREYTNGDRWYLEALGISADRQWDSFLKAWLVKSNNSPLQTAEGKDIIWRARTDISIPYLAQLATDNTIPLSQRLRYFRAFDFNTGTLKNTFLLKMIEDNKTNDIALNKVVLHALDSKTVMQSAAAKTALQQVIASVKNTPEYIELINRYQLTTENEGLLALAIDSAENDLGRDAASALLSANGAGNAWNILNGQDTTKAKRLLTAIGQVGTKQSISMVTAVTLGSKYNMALRKHAALQIGHSWDGEAEVLSLLKAHKVPKELLENVVASVNGAWRTSVRTEAQSYLPNKAASVKKAPAFADIKALTANTANGQKVFAANCSICHQAGGKGVDFGPKLNEIGSKYPLEGLWQAIEKPSAGISFGFEGWVIKLKDNSVLNGIVASKTETDIDLKLPGGGRQQIKMSNVQSMEEMKQSMMPEGLYSNMSTQDIADLLGYLEGLKKK